MLLHKDPSGQMTAVDKLVKALIQEISELKEEVKIFKQEKDVTMKTIKEDEFNTMKTVKEDALNTMKEKLTEMNKAMNESMCKNIEIIS